VTLVDAKHAIGHLDTRGEARRKWNSQFALLPDGSLLLRLLGAPPAGTKAGLKLCKVSGTLGVVDSTGTFTP